MANVGGYQPEALFLAPRVNTSSGCLAFLEVLLLKFGSLDFISNKPLPIVLSKKAFLIELNEVIAHIA